MFERFRKSHGSDAGASSLATRERDNTMDGTTDDRELDPANDRVDSARFERTSPGERDRGVVAGGGEADLAADRAFERDDMSRGATDGDTALDRDSARSDLGDGGVTGGAGTTADDRTAVRDDMAAREDMRDRDGITMRDRDPDRDTTDRDHHHGMARGAAAAGAGAAAGAAIEHHHGRKVTRDEMARDDVARDEAMRDDAVARERGMGGDTMARDTTAGGTMTRRGPARDLDRDGVDDRVERHGPVIAPAALDTMQARQRDRFGGFQWGSDFFGWLCAIGLASILTAALVGAGVALGLSTDDASNANTAQQIGLGGGIALLLVLAIAWFCGGYVAGRMARFDGARQGIGVWLWTVLAAIVVAALAAIGGSEYDIFQRLNLPRIAVGDNTLTTGGAIAGAAAIIVTLLFAIIGGKVGERYHRRVDRLATDEYVVER
jgi:hypothetical protein